MIAKWPWKGALAGIVTVVASVVMIVFGWYLLRHTDMAASEWERTTWVFKTAEAIVFAAIGWLFGREVHRERADAAEQRANQNQKKATAGEALALNVAAKRQVLASGEAQERRFTTEAQAQIRADLAELNVLADRVLLL